MKKFLSLALALIVVFTLSLTAFAADITQAEAEAIALEDAGYSASQTVYLRSQKDYDDGRSEYEVSFSVKNADGSYTKYDYDISVDGRILSRDIDLERVNEVENKFELFLRQLVEWFISLFR